MLFMIISKSLNKKLSVISIEILFQKSRFDVIAAQNYFTRNFIFANLLITGFLKPFGLLIYAEFKISWKIEYTTPCPTCEHTVQSFSHISYKLVLSIILLKMSLLIPSLIIRVAILMAMQFFLIFCSYRVAESYWGPSFIRFQTFFFMNIALVSLDHYDQLAKSLSFFLFDLLEELFLFLFSPIVFFESLSVC